MFYSIRHITKFKYGAPIHENVMDARMHPCTDDHQQCLNFYLHVRPATSVFSYQDYLNNTIHHFNIPGLHTELSVTAEATVQMTAPLALPAMLSEEAWAAVDQSSTDMAHWEMVMPSTFTPVTPALLALADELKIERRTDPLTVLRELNSVLNRTFAYVPKATRVDSPIDEAIAQRRGVCQDYAHIMLALVRNVLRMPCRYVSGYLYHNQTDRSTSGATHAWVEVLLPDLGWVGFDPTNDLIASERHIRVAVGRDYNDVPPTQGVFKGKASSELSVSVHVRRTDDLALIEDSAFHGAEPSAAPAVVSYVSPPALDWQEQLEQQQQQQQQ
ncbi:transglutaminase family protein [soil metagenome]